MSKKYKLVPVEPIQEMIDAALKSDHAEISPRKIVEQDYKAMLAAAPAVQGEPVGWYTEDHLDDKSATTYSAEVAQRWRDKGWPVWPLYAAPQSVTDELPARTSFGGPQRFATAEQQPAQDVAGLVEALVACARASSAAEVGLIVDDALAAYRKGGDV